MKVAFTESNDWNLWDLVCLRATGFPAHWPLRMALTEVAVLADDVFRHEHAFALEKRRCSEALSAELARTEPRSQARSSLARQLKSLQGDRILALDADRFPELARAQERLHRAQEAFTRGFEEDRPKLTRALQEIATDARFQEAVLWQNLGAFQNGILPLLRFDANAGRPPSQVRQHEQMVAGYLQRYCLKNDSIGFFGPVGWAGIKPEDFHIRASPGRKLLRSRTVYWEGWAMDCVAQSLSRLPGIRPWIAPRMKAYIGLEEHGLALPGKPSQSMTDAHIALLRLCNGEHCAAELCERAEHFGMTAAEAAGALEQFEAAGLLDRTFRAPLEPHASDYLSAQIQRIGDPALRDIALSTLAELEAARIRVAEAQGDPARLHQALDELNATFARLTNTAPTQGAGRNYAGRTLVYEDCQRDYEMVIGGGMLERLSLPLELLLIGGKWIMQQLALHYTAAFSELLSHLQAATGQSQVDVAVFWQQAQGLLSGPGSPAPRILQIFQEKWAGILCLDAQSRQVDLDARALEPLVRAAFPTDGPAAWQSARYQCPDIMVAAPDLEAFQQGNYQLVMGEIHLAQNTQAAALFVQQHPHPEELIARVNDDLPTGRLQIVPPRDWEGYTTRTSVGLLGTNEFRLIMSDNISSAPMERQLAIGDLVIEIDNGKPVVRTRDGRAQFDLIEACGDALSGVAVDMLKLLPEAPHQPRVVLSNVVVARETWRVALETLGFAQLGREDERFLRARHWASTTGIPRFVFVKSDIEGKPFFVDFESPVFVEIFCKVIRRSAAANVAALRITEMHPTPDDAWLTDSSSAAYTCEMRCVIVEAC